jgi:hypothetical protein
MQHSSAEHPDTGTAPVLALDLLFLIEGHVTSGEPTARAAAGKPLGRTLAKPANRVGLLRSRSAIYVAGSVRGVGKLPLEIRLVVSA